LPFLLFADYKPESGKDYIEVQGTAELEIVPDEIYIGIKISERTTKRSDLQEIEEKMISVLKNNDIDAEKSLKVSGMNTYYRAKLFYVDNYISKNYELMVSDATKASKIISQINKIGDINASINYVDHSKIDSLRKEVRIMAIKAAKEKAIYLTQAIGNTIGKAIWIKSDIVNYNRFANHSNYSVNALVPLAKSSKTLQDKTVKLEFQNITLKSTVEVYFEIE
jgi:hypothetical protein